MEVLQTQVLLTPTWEPHRLHTRQTPDEHRKHSVSLNFGHNYLGQFPEPFDLGPELRQQLIFDRAVNDDLRDPQGAQGLEALLDRQILPGPTGLQFRYEAIVQHHDQGMPRVLASSRTCTGRIFNNHRFARAKVTLTAAARVRTVRPARQVYSVFH
jgi:hypothetical protein